MKQLFKRRLGAHLVRMARYLKYVFNDFFVIALIFFVGGLGLAYSNFLKTLRSGTWWISLVIGLVVLITVQIGRLATLTQKPDYVFLLPKDRPMKTYLLQAFKYSEVNATVAQVVVWFLLLPLFRIQFKLGWPGLLSWLLIMIAMKFTWLMSSLLTEFQGRSWLVTGWLNKLVGPVLIITISILITPWLGLLIAVVWSLVLIGCFSHEAEPVNWLRVIRTEDRRMHDIYTIFNMFVDVPNFGSSISRRRYLTPLFKLIPLKRINTYLYLYWHGFVRDKEFSNLYLRLGLIGLIILTFLHGTVLPIIMGLVFIYLIAFQMVPFYFHFESNAFVHIYPLAGLNQVKSFQKMLWTLMLFIEVLFGIGILINTRSLGDLLILLALMLIETYGMVNLYLNRQIKK